MFIPNRSMYTCCARFVFMRNFQYCTSVRFVTWLTQPFWLVWFDRLHCQFPLYLACATCAATVRLVKCCIYVCYVPIKASCLLTYLLTYLLTLPILNNNVAFPAVSFRDNLLNSQNLCRSLACSCLHCSAVTSGLFQNLKISAFSCYRSNYKRRWHDMQQNKITTFPRQSFKYRSTKEKAYRKDDLQWRRYRGFRRFNEPGPRAPGG